MNRVRRELSNQKKLLLDTLNSGAKGPNAVTDLESILANIKGLEHNFITLEKMLHQVGSRSPSEKFIIESFIPETASRKASDLINADIEILHPHSKQIPSASQIKKITQLQPNLTEKIPYTKFAAESEILKDNKWSQKTPILRRRSSSPMQISPSGSPRLNSSDGPFALKQDNRTQHRSNIPQTISLNQMSMSISSKIPELAQHFRTSDINSQYPLQNSYPDNNAHWNMIMQLPAKKQQKSKFDTEVNSKHVTQSPNLTENIGIRNLEILVDNDKINPEERQLRLIQELALLDKECDELKERQIQLRKKSDPRPVIRKTEAREAAAAHLKALALATSKANQKALLEKALSTTRARLQERTKALEEKRKRISRESDQEKFKELNICLNCGGAGHDKLKCRHKSVDETTIQKALQQAKEQAFQNDTKKLHFKSRADQYKVSRNDLFIRHIRERVPDGMIRREHLTLLCEHCAKFGHVANKCTTQDADSNLFQTISSKLREFTQIFFFHLNDDNLIDFSKKFQLFDTMDAIVRGRYLDPVFVARHF